jgi:class 3 adenylate cyclase/tetratricopeptide (TPR) repeat protein
VSATTERKLVTVLFCDLVGSTALGELLDPEALQGVQQAYFGRMRAVIEQRGGTVEKFAGDAVVAVFGIPTLHEDDAERAVRCAFEMDEAFLGLTDTLRPRFGVELSFRIGVQTGEAVVSRGTDTLATGDVMNTAARLEQQAAPGQILVGRETVLLTADVVEYGDEVEIDAKGKAHPVRARPALRLSPHDRRPRSPLVGRTHELELLAAALEHAISESTPQTVLVVGEPGIGKTRLAAEFSARIRGRATFLRGACLAYGEGSTWRPFEEIVRNDAGIVAGDDQAQALFKLTRTLEGRHADDELQLVLAHIAPLAGASGPAITSEQDLRWGLRRYVQAIGSIAPVVLLLDDLHWADETLLDALVELVDGVSSVPLVIVLQGRPELRERLTAVAGRERTRLIALGGLSQEESSAFVDNLAATLGTGWAADVRASVVERGDGSPLFLEEVAAMARDEGLEAGVPDSLRALIAARLDLLPPDTRRIAQVAAVVGDVFTPDTVEELSGISSVFPAIERLATRGFVDRAGGTQFSFHHALIREVTYLSLPKVERAELHRRAAGALRDRVLERPESILSIARHLDHALLLRREVFPAEAVDSELVEATVDALRRAAAWTGANASVRESLDLLRRAVSIAEADRGLAQLAGAQLSAMLARSGRGTEAVALAEEVLGGSPPPEAAAIASLALAEDARSRADAPGMAEAATRALELARPLNLPLVEVDALDIVGLADSWAGRLSVAVERRQRAIEIARTIGDIPRVAWNMAGYNALALLGLGRLDETEQQATEAMRLATESGSLRALESAHTVFAFLRRAQDRLDEAVAHGRERLRLTEDLGERLWLFNSLTVSLARPLIELSHFDEARTCLDRALAISRELNSPLESLARAQRVTLLLAEGRLDDAKIEADHIDTPSEALFALAELRGAERRVDEADAIWRRLLDELAAGEDKLDIAEVRVGYARLLAVGGRVEEATAQLTDARALIQGTGAKLHERLIREAEALLG